MKIRIWHLVSAFCILLLIVRLGMVIDIYRLLFYWTADVFSGSAVSLSPAVIDYFISALFIIILPAFMIVFRKRIKFLGSRIILSSAVLILLILGGLFAPLLANFNPDFQKNLSVTKLLPPFTVKYFVSPVKQQQNNFLSLRSAVIKESFDEELLTGDSLAGGKLYQGNSYVDLQQTGNYTAEGRMYLLGTDELGRDIYSRLVYGTRISLTVGILSVLLALFTGLFLGFFSGYYEGWLGAFLNRVTDMFLSFPSIFLIILIIALFGNSFLTVVIVLGFTGWMPLFKVIRGEVKALKSKDFFVTASSLGLSKPVLIFREMLPVVIAPVISALVLLFSNVIIAEASLSYLGLGTGMLYPSWGSMIQEGQSYMRSAWWLIFTPGLLLFITVFSANNFGKKIQFHFNPRIR